MTNPTDLHDGIVAVNEALMTNFRRGDAAGIAALYTEDGQFLPPHNDFVTGRKAIQVAFQGFIDSGVKEIKLESFEVEEQGNTAYEVGMYTLEGEGGQVLDKGKFIVIWRQEAGQWKLHRDIINTSMAVPE